MGDINIVTGYWNVRSDRSESVYLDNFKNVLSLSHNMTVFVPKKYEQFVYDNRLNLLDKTDIVIVELDDIKNKYFKNFWDKLQSIRLDPGWYNSTHWLTGTPQSFSEWYNPIVMSKVFFIHEAYERNTFDSSKFIWVDAGITQHISSDIVCDDSLDGMAKNIKSVLFPSIDYVSTEVHGFHYSGFKKYTNIIPKWLCRATIFGCDRKYVKKFKEDYSYYLKDTLELGYLGTEESIFSLLSCVDAEIYNRYHTEKASMPNKFLQKMKEMEGNKDLIISAIANYGVDKIKNYINSINSCGFNGDKVMIVYNVPDETIKYLQSNGWLVCVGELTGHPHMKRLIDIYVILRQLGKEYRYVITTDVRDVIFQTNPSEYLKNYLKKKIIVSSENVLYRHEPWGKKNILEGYNELFWERYESEETCNVGVIAGYHEDMMELLLLNYIVSQAGNTQHFTDQSSFNFVIHNKLVKDKIQMVGLESHWALQIGTLSNPELIGKCEFDIKDGIIFNGENPFVIIHQYDRNELTKNLIK
jgi:hypothetical protein